MAHPIRHCDMCGSDLGQIATTSNDLKGFYFCSQMCVDNAKEEVNFASRFNEPVEKPYAAAHEVLEMGAKHMKDRAVTYDNADGERSMAKTVAAFNALTGHNVTTEQGWLMLCILKMSRSQQGEFKLDNYEDGAAYFALMGEQASIDRG